MIRVVKNRPRANDPHWFCLDRSIYTNRIIALHVGPIIIWFRETA